MNESSKEIEALFDELITSQKAKLLECGRQWVPTLTPEDMLQPNDYPELEDNPHFRYEEGILHGLLSTLPAMRLLFNRLRASPERRSSV